MDHLSEENIRFSEIYLKHKEFLRRLFLFGLFFADILIILFLAFRFITYNSGFIQAQQVENYLTASYIPYSQIRQQLAPVALQVDNVTMVNTQTGKYDLVVKISNSNEKMMAEAVNMVATIDGAVTEPYETYVLPNSVQYAFWFGLESSTPNPSARVEILETDWKRIRDREPLEILKKIKFSTPQFKNLKNGFIVESQLNNNSAYSFWHMGVIVLAMRQGEVVGANVTSIEKVKAGSSRLFNVSWPTAITTPQEVKLVPFINVYDEDVYMPLTSFGQPGDPSGVEY